MRSHPSPEEIAEYVRFICEDIQKCYRDIIALRYALNRIAWPEHFLPREGPQEIARKALRIGCGPNTETNNA